MQQEKIDFSSCAYSIGLGIALLRENFVDIPKSTRPPSAVSPNTHGRASRRSQQFIIGLPGFRGVFKGSWRFVRASLASSLLRKTSPPNDHRFATRDVRKLASCVENFGGKGKKRPENFPRNLQVWFRCFRSGSYFLPGPMRPIPLSGTAFVPKKTSLLGKVRMSLVPHFLDDDFCSILGVEEYKGWRKI